MCYMVYIFYIFFFFFSSRRRHTRLQGDWSSDVYSSDLPVIASGVVRALSSVSDAFCGTTVALIVSPSTREMVSSSLRLRSKGISSVNMGFLRVDFRYGEC